MDTETKSARPDCVTQEHLEYLDELRESGETNMFGAGACLREEFYFTKQEASAALKYWMETFPRKGKA